MSMARALSLAVTAADIALPPALFDDFWSIACSIVRDMEKRLTFARLGVHTNRIAARLMAARDEIREKAAAGALGGEPAAGVPELGEPTRGNEIVGERVPTRLPMRPGAFVPSMCPAG